MIRRLRSLLARLPRAFRLERGVETISTAEYIALYLTHNERTPHDSMTNHLRWGLEDVPSARAIVREIHVDESEKGARLTIRLTRAPNEDDSYALYEMYTDFSSYVPESHDDFDLVWHDGPLTGTRLWPPEEATP